MLLLAVGRSGRGRGGVVLLLAGGLGLGGVAIGWWEGWAGSGGAGHAPSRSEEPTRGHPRVGGDTGTPRGGGDTGTPRGHFAALKKTPKSPEFAPELTAAAPGGAAANGSAPSSPRANRRRDYSKAALPALSRPALGGADQAAPPTSRPRRGAKKVPPPPASPKAPLRPPAPPIGSAPRLAARGLAERVSRDRGPCAFPPGRPCAPPLPAAPSEEAAARSVAPRGAWGELGPAAGPRGGFLGLIGPAVSRQMPGVTVKDVNQQEFVRALAAFLKK